MNLLLCEESYKTGKHYTNISIEQKPLTYEDYRNTTYEIIGYLEELLEQVKEASLKEKEDIQNKLNQFVELVNKQEKGNA